MKISSWAGLSRFTTVLNLFISIFWAFYSLKFKKYWHKKPWLDNKRRELYISEAHRFRITAVKLGGLLIKLGQFFSTRVDILPQSTINELTGLQDEVQPFSFQDICQVAQNEFNQPLSEIFEDIEEIPLASASLGQVHRGKLVGGQIVAVKLLRPGIEDLVNIDLRAVHKVIDLLKIFTDWERFVDFNAVYKEFSDTLLAELDYIQEGHNAETIAANTSEDPDILIPAIYWNYTTRRVLTMEYMQGIKISDYESIEKAGVDREAAARKLIQIYVKQVLVDGFFHADPHPGNIFITVDGRIVLVDFGMVGTISPSLRDTLVKMSMSLVKRDYYDVVGYLKKIGFLRYDADNELIARAIGILIEETLGVGQDLSSADLSGLLNDLEQLLYEQPFQIPAQFTFLGRALGTLYGLCIGLDPNISILDESKPYLEVFASGESSLWNVIKEKASVLGSSIIELPPLAERVLRRMERGDLTLKIPFNELNTAVNANTNAIYSLAWSLSFGFTLLTAAYLLANHFIVESRFAFYGSGLIFLIMLMQNHKNKRRKRKAPHPPIVIRRGRNS